MQPLPHFELLRPANLDQALTQLALPGARALGGGTDLLPNLRRGLEQPSPLIDLGDLPGFADIDDGAQGLSLGGGVTLARLAGDAALARSHAAIVQAAQAVAGPSHRTVATLGGNLCQDTRCVFYNQSEWWRAANGYCLKRGGDTCHVAPQGRRCHAAFSGDLAPALMALGAEVELRSLRGARWLPLHLLYRDDGADALCKAPDELLLRVRLPAPPTGLVSAYRKARVRGAMDFPLAGVACALAVDQGRLSHLSIALTGTNSRPLLLEGSADWIGRSVDADLLPEMQAAVGKLVQKQVSPMRSTVTASNHRRLVAAALAQRLLADLVQAAACG
ncbi:MAG: FAD binding domain-containing protein [Rubrivivax sp.]|nr:FAD binding domain-containing protein [Rubrivivax sp.]MBK7264698.1 FAD binding domain-containing protein [Rubrivivax sp.]MBK8526945.1 FAD binding domain-containing protein [Rubrivivax sp.]